VWPRQDGDEQILLFSNKMVGGVPHKDVSGVPHKDVSGVPHKDVSYILSKKDVSDIFSKKEVLGMSATIKTAASLPPKDVSDVLKKMCGDVLLFYQDVKIVFFTPKTVCALHHQGGEDGTKSGVVLPRRQDGLRCATRDTASPSRRRATSSLSRTVRGVLHAARHHQGGEERCVLLQQESGGVQLF
jgi:hypothetical protein